MLSFIDMLYSGSDREHHRLILFHQDKMKRKLEIARENLKMMEWNRKEDHGTPRDTSNDPANETFIDKTEIRNNEENLTRYKGESETLIMGSDGK